MAQKLRAIDLYSGIGGWSLGLRLAGIEVVSSYDIWGEANETNFLNNGHVAQTVDIRRLPFGDLPTGIEVVVGSPPCTQFSYANRGGNGNVEDGLLDVAQFLKVVKYVQPKFWVMENVPRVLSVVHSALEKNGPLEEFAEMQMFSETFDMSLFGVPQRRKRCLISNFDLSPFDQFKGSFEKKTLGEVVWNLSSKHVKDPTYKVILSKSELTENQPEQWLNDEEIRINRALKTQHHIYNSMRFPDALDECSRTITATCTRVSRESVVIQPTSTKPNYRRLSVRERGCLQGFPISYQFYASSHAKKSKMIGNAVPPSFAYLVASIMQGQSQATIKPLSELDPRPEHPVPAPPETNTDRAGKTYPRHRRFRFAIPSLQLKSGVRFELSNLGVENRDVNWGVKFWFGTPKSIQSIRLYDHSSLNFREHFSRDAIAEIERVLALYIGYFEHLNSHHLQGVWAHRGPSQIRPFDLLDKLSEVGLNIESVTKNHESSAQRFVDEVLRLSFGRDLEKQKGVNRLIANAPKIAAGFILAPVVNAALVPATDSENKNRIEAGST